MDKAKDPDPGGSDQQNLGYKKLKNRKADRTVGLNNIYIFQCACFWQHFWGRSGVCCKSIASEK